jgi:hypothetical protein
MEAITLGILLVITLYVSIYIIDRIFKAKRGNERSFSNAVIITILIFAVLFISLYIGMENITTISPKSGSNVDLLESDDEEVLPPLVIDSMNVQESFQVMKGQTDEPIDQMMNYDKFLEVMKTPEFKQKYYESVLKGLRNKAKRYRTLYRELEREYNAMNNKSEKNDLRKDNSKQIKDIMDKIMIVLGIIRDKRTKLTKEVVYNCLHAGIHDKTNGLASLIGRKEIKDFVCARIYTFYNNPRIFNGSFQNMVLTGNSGWGKTKIGSVISWVYSKAHLLARDNFVTVTSQAFATAYVNESATKTRFLLLSSLESVILIDEAYGLCPPKGHLSNHNNEAITEFVYILDKLKGCSVVNMIGYEEEMNELLDSNQGLRRRFPYMIGLTIYSSEDLAKILINSLHSSSPDLHIDQANINLVYSVIDKLYATDPDIFNKQAGDMINIASEIGHCYYSQLGNNSLNLAIVNGFNSFLKKNDLHIQAGFQNDSLVLQEEF